MSSTKPTTTTPPQKKRLKSVKIIVVTLFVALAGGIAVFGAVAPPPTQGNIVIRAFDTTTSPRKPLDGVTIKATRYHAGSQQCANIYATSGTITDPRNSKKQILGGALFRNCPSKTGAGITYTIRSATKAGYNVSPLTPHAINTGILHLKSGRIHKRTSITNLYMIKSSAGASPSTTPPPSPTTIPSSPNTNVPVPCGSIPLAVSSPTIPIALRFDLPEPTPLDSCTKDRSHVS